MYKLHLILKYLRKRRIAWVSLIAVTLCTAMVLVVISVMGGWLNTFRQSFHGMSGDIIVRGDSLTGFPYYDEMIDAIKALPEVKDASADIRTFGLINVRNQIRRGVQVMGLKNNIRQVNNFADSLHRRSKSQELFELYPNIDYNSDYIKPPRYRGDASQWPGMIVGTGVIGIRKNEQGELDRPGRIEYESWVLLSLLPISPDAASPDIKDKAEQQFWIVDDSHTQMYIYDSDTVYVPFDVLQGMLNMNPRKSTDAQGVEHVEPARASDIQIALKDGADLNAVKKKVEQAVAGVRNQHAVSTNFPYRVETWLEANAKFLSQVEKEKVLLLFLFGIISIVAIFLIFCIFYMIVVEKTRDIGIIKSVGATSGGVAGIFLGYGGAIGVVGAGLGWLLGWLIVHYINELHAWLGKLFGIVVFSPDVYLFDRIPNTMNPREVAVILSVAVAASVLGSIVPAIRAANMHPVEALRWE